MSPVNAKPVSFEVPSIETNHASLSEPPGEGKAPSLIVVHEWWGVNDDIRAICDRFAAEGFLALAVDLYAGKVTEDPNEAMALLTDMKTERSMKVVAAAVDFLRAHPRSNGKVGITGFCMGGAMSIAAACTVPGIGAAAPFYGIPRSEFVDFSAKRPPIQGHYGANDGMILPDNVRAVAAKATGESSFEVFFYEAGHAFMRAKDPSVYDEASSKLAWSRAVPFLKKHLA
jgi:carboxymethylenebutenolidase